jgi:NADH-quinone oxidoreductase subunit J
MTSDLIFFLILALVAVTAAIAMLFNRNAIYSALFLIVNFVSIAMLYLLLGAPFLAMAQVTVYAGAIMVLFLFVIMLLGAEQLRRSHTLSWQQPLAIALGVILLAEVGYIILASRVPAISLPLFATLTSESGGPVAIAEVLFNQNLLPFEVTSILLLVAMVGAIVLTRSDAK